ncbi:MAG: TraR/DksA C4-type zinc finger protein [Planctomycetes bacterium]|nr:TraR/DksA C4-type zinc finger protein [Planctomycetota bacterium]
MLLEKRAELVGDVTHMENEALGKNRSDASGDLSLMPIHMADIGTDNYEQEFTLGLVANERDVVREIDAALARLEQGTFGICLATQKPIAKTRLQIKPWASYCVEYERAQESNGKRRI